MKSIKALIWDMDGTLLNTLDDIVGSCNDALAAQGLPVLTTDQMLVFIGYGARHLCQGVSGLEGEALEKFMQDYRYRAVHREDPQTTMYPGILEIIQRARKSGMKLGIYTNKPEFWCNQLVDRFWGRGVFDEVYGTNEENLVKPDPTPILRMCRHWGILPSDVVMIGDSPVDYEVSVNAGCQSICVSWGYRSRDVLLSSGAPCVVDDAEALSREIFG